MADLPHTDDKKAILFALAWQIVKESHDIPNLSGTQDEKQGLLIDALISTHSVLDEAHATERSAFLFPLAWEIAKGSGNITRDDDTQDEKQKLLIDAVLSTFSALDKAVADAAAATATFTVLDEP